MTHTIQACRSCETAALEVILPLGQTPLANALLTKEQLTQPERRDSLTLAFCPHCSLVQILETVPPAELFSEYLYFSSFSDTMLRHASTLVESVIAKRRLDESSLAAEVASNDGYLLQYYQQRGIPVMGIEPARNIAKVATERGIRTVCDFFGDALADRLAKEGHRADVIHANNVLAHVPDLNGVARGFRRLLKDTGVAIVEVPYVKDMIDRAEFDTIYHEHLCYFSLTALDHLFERHALTVIDVEHVHVHGGSLRLWIAPTATLAPHDRQPSVDRLLQEEQHWGVSRHAFYDTFGQRVERLKHDLLATLHGLKNAGKRIAVYGASAKGSTLLNCFGIGRETLEYVVDRSTAKQGRYTPGTHLPIHPTEKLLEDRPDYVLLLTWNFADEILKQQEPYRAQGGKFIIPIPDVQIV
jgi:SAM-dependent methyltransferase